jgi:hypothetical protein
MTDTRVLVAAGIAGLAIISATILGAMGQTELALGEAALASAALSFIVGLHKMPPGFEQVDSDIVELEIHSENGQGE